MCLELLEFLNLKVYTSETYTKKKSFIVIIDLYSFLVLTQNIIFRSQRESAEGVDDADGWLDRLNLKSCFTAESDDEIDGPDPGTNNNSRYGE